MVAGGDVISTSSPTGYSTVSNKVFHQPARRVASSKKKTSSSSKNTVPPKSTVHKSMNPSRWVEEKLECLHKNPVVCCIDVTGSMGNWTKIIYDKLPMFYGQIMMQNYLEDPSLGFCGVGDAGYDKAALQTSEFGQGRQIDQIISKLWLEGGGGGNGRESYELAAYFYLNYFEMSEDACPFIFFTGDEGFYDIVSNGHLKKVELPAQKGEKMKAHDLFKKLNEKFKGNVFLMKKKYWDGRKNQAILKSWKRAIGEENVIQFQTAKAVVDLMLGIISLKTGVRTLERYEEDLRERGQSEERIKEVKSCLQKLSKGCKFTGLKPRRNPIEAGKVDVSGLMDEGEGEEEEDESEILAMIQTQYKIVRDELVGIKDGSWEDWRKERERREGKKKLEKGMKCEVTGDVFVNPVLLSDKKTILEKVVIEKWFETNDHNPLNGTKLSSKELVEVTDLKEKIDKIFG